MAREIHQPIEESGALEERLHSYMIATMTGELKRCHGLFLGLAEEPDARRALQETIEFLGLIDIQETVIGRKARNTGHKAVRRPRRNRPRQLHRLEEVARVFYMGVPYGGRTALLFLYDAASVLIGAELEDAGKGLEEETRGHSPPAQVEDMIQQMMLAHGETVWKLSPPT